MLWCLWKEFEKRNFDVHMAGFYFSSLGLLYRFINVDVCKWYLPILIIKQSHSDPQNYSRCLAFAWILVTQMRHWSWASEGDAREDLSPCYFSLSLNFGKKVCSISSKWVKWNFITVGSPENILLVTPGKILLFTPGKVHYCPVPRKKSFRRPWPWLKLCKIQVWLQ